MPTTSPQPLAPRPTRAPDGAPLTLAGTAEGRQLHALAERLVQVGHGLGDRDTPQRTDAEAALVRHVEGMLERAHETSPAGHLRAELEALQRELAQHLPAAANWAALARDLRYLELQHGGVSIRLSRTDASDAQVAETLAVVVQTLRGAPVVSDA